MEQPITEWKPLKKADLLDDLKYIFNSDDMPSQTLSMSEPDALEASDFFNCYAPKVHEVLPDRLIEITYEFGNLFFSFSQAAKRMREVGKLKKKYNIKDADLDVAVNQPSASTGSTLKLTITFKPKGAHP